jgi:hypothetical protein
VPFAGELSGWQELSPTEYVQVRVPVLGLYGPFDFERRDPTSNAIAPPLTPPQPPESEIQAIQSIGEAESIRGQSEGDEPGGLVAEPVPDAAGELLTVMGCTRVAKAVVTVVGPDSEAFGMLDGAEHAGIRTATAKSAEAVSSHAKSFKSGVNQLSFSVPARMPKSHSQIVMVLNPCKLGLSWRLSTCFLQVK